MNNNIRFQFEKNYTVAGTKNNQISRMKILPIVIKKK